MNIVTYRPRSDFRSLFESVGRLGSPSMFTCDDYFRVSSPKVHVYEDNNSLILKFDMPGLIKDDIDIDFTNKFLTVSGSRSNKNIESDTNIYQEIDYGEFHRILDLSNYALKDNISAEYNNGILKVIFSLSDANTTSGKKIKIK